MWYVRSAMQDQAVVLQGFKLVFTFSENSFFTNKQLVKTYYMASDDDDTSPVL